MEKEKAEIKLNTLYNGDCLEFMKSMPDKCVDLVLTDPPYGMDYQSAWRTATPQFDKIAGDTSLEFLIPFAKEIYRVLKDDTHAYIFCNDYAISSFRNELEKIGFVTKRTLVWVKNNHTSGDLEGDYGNKTEFILFLHKGRKELNGKRDTNVLEFPRVSLMTHPTEKPVELLKYLIEKSSVKGDVVFDCFVGTGSSLVAAKTIGRGYIGVEIVPEYCKIAEERLKTVTKSMF